MCKRIADQATLDPDDNSSEDSGDFDISDPSEDENERFKAALVRYGSDSTTSGGGQSGLDSPPQIDRLVKIASSLSLANFIHNSDCGGKVWILWGEAYSVVVQSMSDQFIHTKILYKPLGVEFLASFVYASCDGVTRRALWSDLSVLGMEISTPWLLSGDFNVVSNLGERLGVALHNNIRRGPAPFRFQRMWVTHDSYNDMLKDSWSVEVVGSPMQALATKLKRFRGHLKPWNIHTFGNVHQNLRTLEDRILIAESSLERVWEDEEDMLSHIPLSLTEEDNITLLSRGLSAAFGNKKIGRFHTPRQCDPVTHLLYADDTIIFLNGMETSVKGCMEFLDRFCLCSGQKINVEKSSFMMYSKTPNTLINSIVRITGYQHKVNHMTYLGTPIYDGRVKVIYFDDLLTKIRNKIAGWKANFLTQGESLGGYCNSSNWAAFIRGKYRMDTIILSGYVPPITASKFWKECASLIGSLVHNSAYKVGQGNMSFWHENWSNMGVLAEVFAEVEPPAPISLAEAAEANFSIPDGRFTMKSAFSLLSNQAPACPLARHYWAKFIPKKMAILLWRFLNNAIPVDVRIQDCTISLASGCLCCVHRNIESMEHLFLRGEIAVFLWDRLSPLFGIHRTNYSDLLEFILAWFSVAHRKSQMGIAMGTQHQSAPENQQSQPWHAPSHSPSLRGLLLSGAAGGGVIRDDQGILLAAFHSFYGSGSNNLAETRALLDGLLLCQQLGITNSIVNVDSNLVAGWYNQKHNIPWHLFSWWQRIREATENLNINLRHVYRELNSSADCMASIGLSSRSNCSIMTDFPMRLVGYARLDRLGMPYVRFG
ncbi:Reverse transcriptase zinc-binding domain [Macleaya cordata]|uniref:Reverse transcriptase zinc-binding domain n=1 Tax=Macleaya cordata TaxID=56857 RepID=A0A200QEH6_MACCD|nr:Reverse transcriptase zinc-binding domain [Macleaya cordata]